MVAAANNGRDDSAGAFGGSISRSVGVTFTDRELRAIKRAAGFGSVAKCIRSLIGRRQLERLIERTEREHADRSKQ